VGCKPRLSSRSSHAPLPSRQVSSYHFKGKREFSLAMPAPVLCLEPLLVRRSRVISGYIGELTIPRRRYYVPGGAQADVFPLRQWP
jgi:hypothetical protein